MVRMVVPKFHVYCLSIKSYVKLSCCFYNVMLVDNGSRKMTNLPFSEPSEMPLRNGRFSHCTWSWDYRIWRLR